MATFPSYNPTYSANKKSEPSVRNIKFGDGYENRITFGLHQNPKEWSLTFNETDADSNIIEAFLDARALDNASFDWTPPDDTTPYKWVCQSWSRDFFDFQRSMINVTFRQVFEP